MFALNNISDFFIKGFNMISRTLWTATLWLCNMNQFIGGAVVPPQLPQPTVHPAVLIQMTPQSFSSANTTVGQTTTTTSQQLSEHTVHIKCPDIHLPNMSHMFEGIKSTSNTVKSWLWDNKWSITASIAVCAYGATIYKLRQINQMLQQSSSWCTWKEIVPLGHLATSGSQDLLEQLQFDIHKKYYHAFDAQNTNAVHALFLQDTNLEMEQLDLYLSWYEFYKTIHISKFLPFKYLPEIIHERKARLQFVIDLFIKWYLKQ